MTRPGAELRPIIEFFPLNDAGSDLFLDTKHTHQKTLRAVLQRAQGIYAFYNSEAEVIYIGKTEKQNLWQRMRHSCTQEKSRYERYYVRHPRQKFGVPANGRVRKIVRGQVDICDVATFCSAYSLTPQLIAFSEKLLVRLVPNDLINLRMEGNMSLKAFRPKTDRRRRKIKKRGK